MSLYKQDLGTWQHSHLLGLDQIVRNGQKDSCVTLIPFSFKNKTKTSAFSYLSVMLNDLKCLSCSYDKTQTIKY